MASVCGGTLALMDAGVPIKAPVAGIAMGLVKEGDKIAILSDILGDEDHLGDMDFKVCGTKNGITAIQMDIKITGLTTEIMSRALEQARQGRLHILGEMLKALRRAAQGDQPVRAAHHHHPDPSRVHQERHRAGRQGHQGHHRRAPAPRSTSRTPARWTSPSADGDAVKQAIAMIQALTREAEIGKIYLGTVRKIAEFGAFVEMFPGTDGLIHISELSDKRVKSVSDVLEGGRRGAGEGRQHRQDRARFACRARRRWPSVAAQPAAAPAPAQPAPKPRRSAASLRSARCLVRGTAPACAAGERNRNRNRSGPPTRPGQGTSPVPSPGLPQVPVHDRRRNRDVKGVGDSSSFWRRARPARLAVPPGQQLRRLALPDLVRCLLRSSAQLRRSRR